MTIIRKKGKVVYTFKTKHCTDGVCYGKKVEKYTEISTDTQAFYTQSNDNEVWNKTASTCTHTRTLNHMHAHHWKHAP